MPRMDQRKVASTSLILVFPDLWVVYYSFNLVFKTELPTLKNGISIGTTCLVHLLKSRKGSFCPEHFGSCAVFPYKRHIDCGKDTDY